ncbi:MAG: hypothetical protein IKW99_08480 [Bacteroidales bacterium]|nr:hypothetical protein [Bacteroidales bacterium]
MKNLLLITLGTFLALAPARAQAGLQIDSLFNGALTPASTVTESVVSGKELKPYNLDYFRSIRFKATESEIDRVVSWLEADALLATNKEMDSEDGKLVYVLLRFPADRDRNKYVGYQVKEASGGKYVTVVYLTGKATASDLKVIFKHR